MWNDKYSVLRTNGLLFVSGIAFMSMLAGLGSLMGPPPMPTVVEARASLVDEVDLRGLIDLGAELQRAESF